MKKEDLRMVSFDTWGSTANTGLIASELEVELSIINGIVDDLLKGDMSALKDISVASTTVMDEHNREHQAYEVNEAMAIYIFEDLINVDNRDEVLKMLLKEFSFAEEEVKKLQKAEQGRQDYLHELEAMKREVASAIRHSLIAYDSLCNCGSNIDTNESTVSVLELILKLAQELSEKTLEKGQ